MPNPHFRVEVITRSQGQSVVAAAAYRSGEVLYDEKAGKTFDYTRKEDVVHAEIMTPDHAPDWTNNRAVLWNSIEAVEKRKDAQLARNIIAGLPRELSHEQNVALVRGFVQETFISKGMIADFAIHESAAMDGLKNPHAHILLTLREVSQDGFANKNRDWNSQRTLRSWRNAWEAHTNQHLELAGSAERVSLKSYKDRKINRHATLHLGEDAGNLEKRGIETTKGNLNRRIQHENKLIEMFEPEPEDTSQDADAATPESRSLNPDMEVQNSGSRFLNPVGRFEAMTLALKEDMEEYSDQKSDAGNQKSEKGTEQAAEGSREVTLGAFRSGTDDGKELAESSLSAARAAHDAALFGTTGDEPYQHPDPQKQASREAARAAHEAALFGTTGDEPYQHPDPEKQARREAARAEHFAALFGEMSSPEPYIDPDPEKQAQREAARAEHDAQLAEYLNSPEYQIAREETLQKVRLREYARHTAERIKALGVAAKRQFANLLKETSRLRQKDRDDRDR